MIKIKLQLLAYTMLLVTGISARAQTSANNIPGLLPQYIEHTPTPGAFRISSGGRSATIMIDPDDWKGVIRAANDLGDDVRKVTKTASPVINGVNLMGNTIVIGTIGKSNLIDKLVAAGKLDVSAVSGKWESFLIQTVGSTLVIAGSDKRGTIYGIYDVSEKIGVSPWYWWADAPVKESRSLYVKAGRYVQESPKVKYRGIFINDESPSFSGWAHAKFGGINSKAYVHVFELLLRLKANLLWPAMWNNAFNEDDPMSPVLADEYGIVMGTSHHEPMMRSQREYTVRKNEIGPWDYTTNADQLKKFWFDGLERNKNYENLITVGMRGDGDIPMGKGEDEANIKTLRSVIADQQHIIGKVYGKDSLAVPQAWAIFTEVQRYYDAGLTVPDNITLLFCDNNWGYIRRTGPDKERGRKGGLGLYYHIDMNGGPWNDRWINTTTIPKLREQLNLAYQTGIDREWIINVGDIKPKELPIDFIMHYAWNPNAIPANRTGDYVINWSAEIFGKVHAKEIAELIMKYTKYNLLRKPEVQDPSIFSFVNYNEADRMMQMWNKLELKAIALEKKIPPDAKNAYFELVKYPILASAGVAKIYLDAGRNHLYAKQGRIGANEYAKRARELFETDKKLSDFYNDSIAGGKWKNMMSDIHIGYKRWSMPKENSLPELQEITPLAQPAMGVAVEGSELAWPETTVGLKLPEMDILKKQRYYIDIFNRGNGNFKFEMKADKPWIKISGSTGTVKNEKRVYVYLDWKAVPNGQDQGTITIKQGDVVVPVILTANKKSLPLTGEKYFGGWGEFSIPSQKFSRNIPGKDAKWVILPDLGRSEACMGISPVTAPSATPQNAARLEYNIFIPQAGKTKVCLGILPTQDVNPQRGLRIAVAIDDGIPVIIDARKGFVDTFNEYTPAGLAQSKTLKALPLLGDDYGLVSRHKPRRNEIFDNLRWLDTNLEVTKGGIHKLKVFMIDPEVVLENIIINPDDKYPSYFGAPPMEAK